MTRLGVVFLMFKLAVLASSSAGNSALVATERTRLLVDAGLSRKETFERLAEVECRPSELTAILITHEHSDHVNGLVGIAKRLDVPVFMTAGTAEAIEWSGYSPRLNILTLGLQCCIGDIEVDPFSVPHDAADPVGFSFRADGVKISIATDLGSITDEVARALRGSHALLLESNHDLDMLKAGPYPWALKRRVMGAYGHLSNDAACQFVREELDTETEVVILGHLSEHNNHADLVRLMGLDALSARVMYTRLVVADQHKPTEEIIF